MTEDFIIHYIPERLKQLGYSKWYIRYRDFLIGPANSMYLKAHSELYFVVGSPPIAVYSDYGTYAPVTSHNLNMGENKYEHRGEITLYNDTLQVQRIKLIQVIVIN